MALARGGLPGRDQLEQHLIAMLSRPKRGVLAGFVLDRAAAIHQRFGDAAGERYVFLFVQDLLHLLPSPAKVSAG
jgi:GGDEF domain-containing protein